MPDDDLLVASSPEGAASVEPEPPAAPAQVCYMGPRLFRPFPVSPLTVFRGPLPVPLARAVAEDPDLAACFAPVAELGRARADLNRPATALARAAAAVTARYLMKKEG